MLRAVVFDLDNTLYSYDDAHAHAFRALTDHACRSFGLTPERFEALHGEASRALEERVGSPTAAIHNRLLRCQLILEALGRPVFDAPEMARVYWSTLLERARPFPGAIETLEKLRGMGLKIGVGTNMVAGNQFAKIEALGLAPCVDFIVTSEEVGAEKPDARLFDWCARKAGCKAGQCLFVGDSLKGDVYGALGAGMSAIWLRGDRARVPGVMSVASLEELPERIVSMI